MRRTLASRQDSIRLTRVLAEGGSTSLLDVRQSEQLVFTAGSEVPSLEQQIDQQENFISILLGNNPAAVGATVRTQRRARQSFINFAYHRLRLRRPDSHGGNMEKQRDKGDHIDD